MYHRANGAKQMPTATKKNKAETAETTVTIQAIDIRHIRIKLVGDSPLISHRWSDKAKKMMLEKQTKRARQAKEAKDPEQDFKDSLYIHPEGGYGFPAVAFKSSAVSSCRYADMKMTEARGAFHVQGELVPIDGDEPTPREDMVRIGMGTADIRYRGEFVNWSATLPITYNARAISPEQIINLFNIAGFGVGVGEWRPERDGQYGRFHVASTDEA